MSKVAIQGDASGTGTFTIAAPNSNSNYTLTLPDASGTVAVQGGAISGTTGTFTGLVDISAAGAGQIQFPATQNASSNANTLDDYEEGTWTPTFSTGSASTINFTYTKIGRLVHITGYMSSPSGWPSSAMLLIGGLPFVGNANYQMSLLWYNGSTSVIAAAYLAGGGSTLSVRPIGGYANSFTELSVQMTYITN